MRLSPQDLDRLDNEMLDATQTVKGTPMGLESSCLPAARSAKREHLAQKPSPTAMTVHRSGKRPRLPGLDQTEGGQG